MRQVSLLLLALLAAVILASGVRADRVVYTKLVGAELTADTHRWDVQSKLLTDLWQKDLVTGKTTLLVSHDAVPGGFKTRIEEAKPSPDNAYLLIEAGAGQTLTFPDGRVEQQYGTELRTPPNAKGAFIRPSYWVYSFGKGRMLQKTVSDSGRYPLWSPGGLQLLNFKYAVLDPKTRREINPALARVYDVATETNRTIAELPTNGSAYWASDGSGVIVTPYANGKARTLISLDGRRRTLPRELKRPDSTTQPVYFTKDTVHLKIGGKKSSFKVGPEPETSPFTGVEFVYNKSRTKLAVFWKCDYGEPHINLKEQIWIVDMKTGAVQKHGDWSQSFFDMSRNVLAWTADNSALIFQEWSNAGTPLGLKKYVLTNTGVDVQPYFDPGKGCVSVTYLPD